MAGTRGFGVFVSTAEGPEPVFILQHRSMDLGVPCPVTEHPISLVSEVRLQYCPWCGANLKDWYHRVLGDLDKSEFKV